jgi:hypothetical protein
VFNQLAAVRQRLFGLDALRQPQLRQTAIQESTTKGA